MSRCEAQLFGWQGSVCPAPFRPLWKVGASGAPEEEEYQSRCQDEDCRTPLFYAVQRQELSIARALLDAGANPNSTEAGYVEPLRYKANDFGLTYNDLEALNSAGCFGDTTPLFYATSDGNDSMVKLLLSHGNPIKDCSDP